MTRLEVRLYKPYKYISPSEERYVINNAYGWWMYDSETGMWEKYFTERGSAEPNDCFRAMLEPVKPLELLIMSGMTQSKGEKIGLPSCGVSYANPLFIAQKKAMMKKERKQGR